MGIRAVFNIRVATEDGYVDLHKELAELGVAYERCPVDYQKPSEQDVDCLLGRLDVCAKPCLLICEVGLRAAAMGIAFKSARARTAMALQGALGSAGRDLVCEDDTKVLEGFARTADEDSQFKSFIASYVASKVNNCVKRPGSSKICDNVFLAGQLSEEEIREFATKEGCKSVLNLRQPEEAGQFGLGMLAREKEVVEGMGLKYVNVPVPREGNYDLELCKRVTDALTELLATASPVLVHCRTGWCRTAVRAHCRAHCPACEKHCGQQLPCPSLPLHLNRNWRERERQTDRQTETDRQRERLTFVCCRGACQEDLAAVGGRGAAGRGAVPWQPGAATIQLGQRDGRMWRQHGRGWCAGRDGRPRRLGATSAGAEAFTPWNSSVYEHAAARLPGACVQSWPTHISPRRRPHGVVIADLGACGIVFARALCLQILQTRQSRISRASCLPCASPPLPSSPFPLLWLRLQIVSSANAGSEMVDVEAGPIVETPASAAPNAPLAAALVASMLMGLAFGSVMDLGKVTLPIVIREQFIFQRFIMLKMFLGAAGGSAFFLAILSQVAPQRFEVARTGFVDSVRSKGLAAVVVGPMILGAGMALGGACPGMVLIQCGSGVPSAPATLAGGFVAAIIFGVVQPYLVPAMCVANVKKEKPEDFKMLSKVPFWAMAMAMTVAIFVTVGILEYFFPWDSDTKQPRQWAWTGELPGFSTAWKDTLPPELMGVCVGALQIPAVLFCYDTLGSSSAYMTLSSQLLVVKGLQDKAPHWSGFRLGVGNWWQAVYILFAILGAFITSWNTGTFGKAKGVSTVHGFIGGFLMIFGSRIGSGCTSGHGLSGMGLLMLKSIVAVPMMFLGGIIVGFAFQAVDPAGYTGFAYTTYPVNLAT